MGKKKGILGLTKREATRFIERLAAVLFGRGLKRKQQRAKEELKDGCEG